MQDRSVLLREVIYARANRVSRQITEAIEEIGRQRFELATSQDVKKPVEAQAE